MLSCLVPLTTVPPPQLIIGITAFWKRRLFVKKMQQYRPQITRKNAAQTKNHAISRKDPMMVVAIWKDATLPGDVVTPQK